MICPKCKARIGVMKHEIILDFAVVHVDRCVICGYWSQPHHPYNQKRPVRQSEAVL